MNDEDLRRLISKLADAVEDMIVRAEETDIVLCDVYEHHSNCACVADAHRALITDARIATA